MLAHPSQNLNNQQHFGVSCDSKEFTVIQDKNQCPDVSHEGFCDAASADSQKWVCPGYGMHCGRHEPTGIQNASRAQLQDP